MKLFIPSLALSLIAAGCSSSVAPSPATAPLPTEVGARGLVGEWALSGLDGVPISTNDVRVRFHQDGRFEAQIACNSALGRYAADGGSVALSDLRFTERGCDQPFAQAEALEAAIISGPFRISRIAPTSLQLVGKRRMDLRQIR